MDVVEVVVGTTDEGVGLYKRNLMTRQPKPISEISQGGLRRGDSKTQKTM